MNEIAPSPKAVIEALEARAKKAEADLLDAWEAIARLNSGAELQDLMRRYSELVDHAEAAEAQNAKLKEALSFYAHRPHYASRSGMKSPVSDDNFGDRARAVLAETEGNKSPEGTP